VLLEISTPHTAYPPQASVSPSLYDALTVWGFMIGAHRCRGGPRQMANTAPEALKTKLDTYIKVYIPTASKIRPPSQPPIPIPKHDNRKIAP
jgi:hypothetical protein